jgi:hypothetical protein
MTEEQLRELFKATNTAEPLIEGWPGLLRYGHAVAEAERERCAKLCEEQDTSQYPRSEEDTWFSAACGVCAHAIRGYK